MTATTEGLLPLDDPSIDWADYSSMKELTCLHHPGARYLTKNPWSRSLHMVGADVAYVRETRPDLAHLEDEVLAMMPVECPCPMADLRYVPCQHREDSTGWCSICGHVTPQDQA